MENLDKIVLDEINEKGEVLVSDLVEKTKIDIDTLLSILSHLENNNKIILYHEAKDIMKTLISNNESYLDKFNLDLHNKTLETKKKVDLEREIKWYVDFDNYNINILKNSFLEIFKNVWYVEYEDEMDLTFTDRNKFNSDITIKLPNLISKYKWSGYIKDVVPKLITILNNSNLVSEWIITNIEQKWIYINISLNDEYLFKSMWQVLDLWSKYWENDIHKWESVVIDYSSPNTAKHLHAWHIRSTIIGHVLSNLYDSNWYVAHRVNHLNDWGGFGNLIEWYERWKDIMPNFEIENDMLFFIYTIFRKWEKASSDIDEFNKFTKEDILELKKYYWEFVNYEDFAELFLIFKNNSANRFYNLEKWKKQEVHLWEKMVKWSMDDFNKFYNLLWIHQDYIIWESFYSKMWKNIVLDLEKKWKVLFYEEKNALNDISLLKIELDNEKITEKEYENIKNEILNDIWCYLVPLDNFERFVILKKNESTIYATRDLAAIKYRNDIYNPSRIVYEVWQEQGEHFDKLFKSSNKIWIENINFSHVYHWFYVDSESKKKLSSRDWASNVQNLINSSIKYFTNKYEWSNDFTKIEVKDLSYKLAIWSIIFNDLNKDKKSSVLISKDITEACKIFEASWGAYIMYAFARAKSILWKYSNNIPDLNDIELNKLEDIEKKIINQFNKYPLIIKNASDNDNPAILAEYLLNLSRNFNTFYNAYRVLDWSDYRLKILESFIVIIKNWMNLLHIEVPNKI